MTKLSRDPQNNGSPSRFMLNKRDAKMAGVCAGIADYAQVDAMIVRIAFVLGALFSFGTAALVYLAIALIAD